VQLALGDEMFLQRAGRFKATEQREKRRGVGQNGKMAAAALAKKSPFYLY